MLGGSTPEAREHDAAFWILERPMHLVGTGKHVISRSDVFSVHDLETLKNNHRMTAVMGMSGLHVAGWELHQQIQFIGLGIVTEDLHLETPPQGQDVDVVLPIKVPPMGRTEEIRHILSFLSMLGGRSVESAQTECIGSGHMWIERLVSTIDRIIMSNKTLYLNAIAISRTTSTKKQGAWDGFPIELVR